MKRKITAVVLSLVMALGAAAPSFAAPILAEKQGVRNEQNDNNNNEKQNRQNVWDKNKTKTPQVNEPLTETTTERLSDKTEPKQEKGENKTAEEFEKPEPESTEGLNEGEAPTLTRPDENTERPTLPDVNDKALPPYFDDDDRPDFDDDRFDVDDDRPDFDDDDRFDFDDDDREGGKPDFDCYEKEPKAEIIPDINGGGFEYNKTEEAPPFQDVEKGSWYYNYVDKAYKKGLISGKSEKSFAPKDTVTGAELLVMLFRAEGHTLGPVLAEKRWYQNAVDWAWENGILTSDLKAFNPDAPITREDVIYILCRYLLFKGSDIKSDNDLKQFGDRGLIDDYALSSAGLLVDKGIISGTEGKLNPKDNLTRAEGAVMLVKIFEDILDKK